MSAQDILNLNPFLQPNDSIPAKQTISQVPWKFGYNQSIQSKQMRLSSVNLSKSVLNSTFSSGTFGIANNTTINLTTKITNNTPHGLDPTFSLPHIGLYQGTAQVGSLQIYPALGNGIATAKYVCWGGYNYQSFDGIVTAWTVSISNTSGGSQTIYYAIQHKYLQTNSGTQG